MGTSMNGWAIPPDGVGALADMSRDVDQVKRRQRPPRAGQILGPGIAPQAVRIVDWNGDETLFNGFYYSDAASLNSPNPAKRWMGTNEVTSAYDGVQILNEMDVADGETWRRTFTADAAGVRTFAAWVKIWPITHPVPSADLPFQWDTGTSVQYATSVGNDGIDHYAYGVTATVPVGGARWCLINLGRSGWAPTNGACFLKFWTWVNGIAQQWLSERFHNNASPSINFAGHWNIALPVGHLAAGATFDNRGLLNVDPGGSGFWLGASGYSISWFR